MGSPKRRVFSLVGDGGFLTNNELLTAVREQVPLTFVIFNDACFSMVRHGHMSLYKRSFSFETGKCDFAKIAEGFGADSVVVETCDELIKALEFSPLVKPYVIDARITESQRIPSQTDRWDPKALLS